PIVQHLTLWVGFLGAAIAAREGKLLALATGTFITGTWRRAADILAAAYGACAAVVLAFGGWQMAMIERESGTQIGAGIPAWITQLVLPVSFTLIALRLVWRVGHATLQEDLDQSRSVDDASALAHRSSPKASEGALPVTRW